MASLDAPPNLRGCSCSRPGSHMPYGTRESKSVSHVKNCNNKPRGHDWMHMPVARDICIQGKWRKVRRPNTSDHQATCEESVSTNGSLDCFRQAIDSLGYSNSVTALHIPFRACWPPDGANKACKARRVDRPPSESQRDLRCFGRGAVVHKGRFSTTVESCLRGCFDLFFRIGEDFSFASVAMSIGRSSA